MKTSGNGMESDLHPSIDSVWSKLALVARCAIFCLGLCLVSGVAAAQSNDNLSARSRLDQIEKAVRDLERYVFKGGTPPAASAASGGRSPLADPNIANRLSGRIAELENQLRDLTGRIEEIQFMTRQVTGRVDKLVGDVDFRLTAIERNLAAPRSAGGLAAADQPRAAPRQGSVSGSADSQATASLGTVSKSAVAAVADRAGDQAGAAAPATTSATASATTAAVSQTAPAAAGLILPDGSVEERYNFAYALLKTANFERAELAFKEFLELHRDSRLAGNAQYWLGESYYVRDDYKNAAGAFLNGFQEFPDSTKAPDNLLKLASSLQALGHKGDACDTLAALAEKFPKASTRIKRSAQRIHRSAGC